MGLLKGLFAGKDERDQSDQAKEPTASANQPSVPWGVMPPNEYPSPLYAQNTGPQLEETPSRQETPKEGRKRSGFSLFSRKSNPKSANNRTTGQLGIPRPLPRQRAASPGQNFVGPGPNQIPRPSQTMGPYFQGFAGPQRGRPVPMPMNPWGPPIALRQGRTPLPPAPANAYSPANPFAQRPIAPRRPQRQQPGPNVF